MANFCSKCGAQVSPDMQFCPRCGAAITEFTEKTPEDEKPAEKTEQENVTAPADEAKTQDGAAAGQTDQAADSSDAQDAAQQDNQQTQPETPAPSAGAPIPPSLDINRPSAGIPKTYNTDRAYIKENAKKRFSSYYWPCVGILFLAFVLTLGINAIPLAWFVSFLVFIPIAVGRAAFCLKLYRGETPDVAAIFEPFKRYGHNLGGMAWMGLFCFLWSLLFVIPGVIKGIAYGFTIYILEDYPTLPAQDALKASMKMTRGHKMDMFVMGLSFIGWGLLNLFTCGILGVFYVGPYLRISLAGQYEEIKNSALATGVITEAQLRGETPITK